MTLAIARYEGTLLSRASAWAKMPDEDLRRSAVQAANDRSEERLWALMEAYLTLHGRSGVNVSEHTTDNYRRGLSALLAHWQGENLLRPGRDSALRYVRELEAQGLQAGSIRVRLAAARLLYRALRWARATEAVPFEDVAAPRDPTPAEEKREAYTAEEVVALVEMAGPVDRALVLLGAHGGLRVSEMLALEWASVNLAASTLKVESGKGRKARTVTLSEPLRGALTALKRESEGRGRVFEFGTSNRARQRLKALCKRAHVPYRGVHALRHHCGTALYQLTGNLRVAAKHLGHASETTTSIYAKMDAREVQDAVSKLGLVA